MKEPYLEKVLRKMRLARVAGWINKGDSLLDVGCGWQASALRHFSGTIKSGVGIDFKVELKNIPNNLNLLAERFDQSWSGETEAFDKAIMLAVLEHIELDRVDFVLSNIRKSLKKNGKLIFTVPTPRGRPVLEFLAYKLGVVNAAEIRDHKLYYDKKLVQMALERNGFKLAKYNTFQFGMNSFGVGEKLLAFDSFLKTKVLTNKIIPSKT